METPAQSLQKTRSNAKMLAKSRQKSLISSALDGCYWNYFETINNFCTPKMEEHQRKLRQSNISTNLRKNTLKRITLWTKMEIEEPIPQIKFIDNTTKLRVDNKVFDIDLDNYVNESDVQLKFEKCFGRDKKFKGLPAPTDAELKKLRLLNKVTKKGRKIRHIGQVPLSIMQDMDHYSDNCSSLSISTESSLSLSPITEEQDTKIEEVTCGRDFCKLGCVCTSHNVGHVVQRHCGQPKCMLKCTCNFGIKNYDKGGKKLRINGRVGKRLR